MSARKPIAIENKPLSLRLGEKLNVELAEAEEETGLSKSDLARLAIQRGLKILREQLKQEVAA